MHNIVYDRKGFLGKRYLGFVSEENVLDIMFRLDIIRQLKLSASDSVDAFKAALAVYARKYAS